MLETFIETFVYAMPHNKSDPLEMCPVSDLLWAEQATLSGWWGYKGVSWSFFMTVSSCQCQPKGEKEKNMVFRRCTKCVGAAYDISK